MAYKLSNEDKWAVSAVYALLALVIFSPLVFRLMNAITSPLGLRLSDARGLPTILGLIVHALVLMLVTRALMK